MIAAYRLLREFGVHLQMPHARNVVGRLWELRAGAVRLLYCVEPGQQIVLLHAFRKKTQMTPAREVAVASRRLAELAEEDE